MHISKKNRWHIDPSQVTPEKDYLNRRNFLRAAGLGAISALGANPALAASAGFPTQRNPDFSGKGLDINDFDDITSYNNFYEFGFQKDDPAKNANKGWDPEPWTIEVDGLVEKPQKFDVNGLVKAVGIEQRVYRFRCVEAWSMVIPWDGFQLSKLLEKVQPTAKAKYVKFVTKVDRKHMVGIRQAPYYPWPFTEGLRLDEAMNELTFLATGIYGKPMPNQNGAPIRLVVPWKYGFKSIKSIAKIELTDKQPSTLWTQLAAREYGFYANVNPEVAHPRWSQARERVVGSGLFAGKVPTLMFNGYEAEVAELYKGMDLKKFY